MKHSHFKATPEFKQKNMNVDRENGVVKNVVIVQEGANKNGSYFNAQFIKDLVAGGNSQKQGVKSRFGHPNMCGTSFGTFIGRYKNFSEKLNTERGMGDEHGQQLYAIADLHLDDTAKKVHVPNGGVSMWEYILDMSENNPDMFGNSIHITSEMFEEEVGNKKVSSHIFGALIASDLVDSPAATNSLFENSDDLGVALTHFLDEHPEIFDVVNDKPEMIEDFFGRYATYLKSKSLTNFNMNFKDKLKKMFSKEGFHDVDLTLADGAIATVVTEGEEPKVGDIVKDSDGKPLTDGDHLLADGRTLVIEGGSGAIKEIKPAAEPPKPADGDEPTMTEVMQSISALTSTVQQFQTTFNAAIKETQEGVEEVATQFSALDKRVTDLGKTVKSKYDAPPAPPTGGKQTPAADSAFDADKAEEIRNRKNNKK